MMTRREAQQRAQVYGATLYSKYIRGVKHWAAMLDTWNRYQRADNAIWREDIEDAVLDCGRIKQGKH